MTDIPKDDLKSYKAALNVAGDYSIQKSMLNFTTARVSSFKKSLFKMPMTDSKTGVVKDAPDQIETAISQFVKLWLPTWNNIENRLLGKEHLV